MIMELTARSHQMSIYTADVAFGIVDHPTLLFIEHCFNHWRDETVCTDAHVVFMKYLVLWMFGLPAHTQLVGIRFADETLAMVNPARPQGPFCVLLRGADVWHAMQVRVEGFMPQWGLETGFWEGLNMGKHSMPGKESEGPQEDTD